MCGIVGFVNHKENSKLQLELLQKMTRRLRNRGPDKQKIWTDSAAGIYLGHARLSILDLSENGDQPMVSNSGRYVIIYNGEIYNHLELRTQLQGIKWRGTSDTETLLAAIDRWGCPKTLQKLIGMFAFALYDRKADKLILARDRFGEKPLYYGWQGKTFLFSSDLKAMAPHPSWQPKLCVDALASYTRLGYVPTPWTIWEHVFKLPPGSWIDLSLKTIAYEKPKPHSYWQASAEWETNFQQQISDEEATEQVEDALRTAISRQMHADVPVGVFLSGGIDSSIITALMQSQSEQKISSFSVGFSEAGFDEAPYAKDIAQYLGTSHTEHYLTSREALDVVPSLADMYSEPFSDSSQIPTYLVSSLAKKNVTVCLSGDAGDELFGGYNRYQWGPKIWTKGNQFPKLLRKSFENLIQTVSPDVLNKMGNALPKKFSVPVLGDQLQKIAAILNCKNLDQAYEVLISTSSEDLSVTTNGVSLPIWADVEYKHFLSRNLNSDPVVNMMFRDTVGYLCDDILTKVDRASMAISLETRIPMLDYDVTKLAWSLPLNMKIRNGKSKWILRQILQKHVPSRLIDRPKQGFSMPLADWLRDPLRDWAEELLNKNDIAQQGYFNEKIVQDRWQEHLSGQRNWQNWLWSILMFQQWYSKQGEQF